MSITQIGSLPFDNANDAIIYSLQHDIPFLPELPLLGDSMLEYINTPGKLSCLKKFKEIEFETVKIQCIGPATLVFSGVYREDEAIQRIYNHILILLENLKAKEVIIFFDEPSLGYVGFDYKEMWEALMSCFNYSIDFNVTFGVHVCGNMDWDQMFKSKIDIISFDASLVNITLYKNYRSKKRIAWGITNQDQVMDFDKGDLITPPCGISPAKYTSKDCQQIYKNIKEISNKVNR